MRAFVCLLAAFVGLAKAGIGNLEPDKRCENTCIYARDGACDDFSYDDTCDVGTDCDDCGVEEVDDTCGDYCHGNNGDGMCDDGGPGSEWAVCGLGSDCSDCGPRKKGGFQFGCMEQCPTHFDDVCDDGGEGSEFAFCDYGTDCRDCGVRTPRTDKPAPTPDPPVSEPSSTETTAAAAAANGTEDAPAESIKEPVVMRLASSPSVLAVALATVAFGGVAALRGRRSPRAWTQISEAPMV